MEKVVFGLSFELHSEAVVVVDVVGGGSGKENTRLFFFWSQWNLHFQYLCITLDCDGQILTKLIAATGDDTLPGPVMWACYRFELSCWWPFKWIYTWAPPLHFTTFNETFHVTLERCLAAQQEISRGNDGDCHSRRWGHSEKHKE